MKFAEIGPIAVHLPEKIETNAQLQEEFPNWQMKIIGQKTGIYQRHIAAEGECSSDLGVAAAEKLFREHDVDPQSIDFLLLCTQTPDYPLPTTACLLQDRLGLKTGVGAFDFNLGCSGFVYGLSIADGLIRSEAAKRVLLITAETYSKFIHATDRSLRTIFGDAATATLIDSSGTQSLSGFEFGTDGSGANTLMVGKLGFRPECDAIPTKGRRRWPSDIYMDGPALINFTVGVIPDLVENILKKANLEFEDVKHLLFHQATFKMLDELQKVLGVDEEKMPIRLKNVGNTVSSTLPILIEQMRRSGELKADAINMLVGFGVGLSWAGCVWRDRFGA